MTSVRARRLRVIAISLASVVGGFVALVLIASAIVHRVWNHERVGKSVSQWASASLSGRGGPDAQAFRIGRVEWPWWPALVSLFGGPPVRVDVYDVGIWDPEGREVMAATHVETGLQLGRLVFAQLWGRLPFTASNLQLHFVDAKVDEIRCRIAPTSSGEINLVAAFRRRPELPPPDKGGMVITVNRSLVFDGKYTMDFGFWSAELEHLALTQEWLRYSSWPDEQSKDGPAFVHRAQRVTAPRGALVIGGQHFPLEDFVGTELRAEDPERQQLRFAGHAKSRGARIEGVGMLRDIYSKSKGVDVQLDAKHGEKTLAALPTRETLRGDPNMTARVHGPFSHVVIEGRGERVVLHAAGITATDASAQFKLDRGALALSKIDAAVANGRVTGSATIVPSARKLEVDTELDGLELKKLGKLAPLEVLAIAAAGVARVVRLDKLHADAEAHFKFGELAATVYVRPKEAFPHRLTLKGTY